MMNLVFTSGIIPTLGFFFFLLKAWTRVLRHLHTPGERPRPDMRRRLR
jgi:hypothetical protein